jgi:succinate dehydrogenase / fumarate reductase cytochrome b subunit
MRLGSVLAVLPLGIWTLVHLWNNLAVYKSADAWQHEVTEYTHPVAFFVSLVVVLMPLGLHIVWGIGRLFRIKPRNAPRASVFVLLQRLTALGLTAFLGVHVWLALLDPRMNTGHAVLFDTLAREIHRDTQALAVYLLGTLGIAYHLAHGFYTFFLDWGLVTAPTSQKRLAGLSVGVFIVVLVMGCGVIYGFWSAGA